MALHLGCETLYDGEASPEDMAMSKRKKALADALKGLWKEHDRMERMILLLERCFTDKELRRMGAAAGGDD